MELQQSSRNHPLANVKLTSTVMADMSSMVDNETVIDIKKKKEKGNVVITLHTETSRRDPKNEPKERS